MRVPEVAVSVSRRHVSETFCTERSRFLLSWDRGPVLGTVQDDGALHVSVPADTDTDTDTEADAAAECGVASTDTGADTRSHTGARTGTRIGLDGDAVLYVESRELFVNVNVNVDLPDADTEVAVVETGLSSGNEGNGGNEGSGGSARNERRWHTVLPPAEHGHWTLRDVVDARDEEGAPCLVLTVEDGAGTVEFHQIGPGRPTRAHRPVAPGQLVHWDLRYDAAVLREDRGPWEPRLHLERPLSHAAASPQAAAQPHADRQSVTARWADGWEGCGLLVETPPGAESRLLVWDLTASVPASPTPIPFSPRLVVSPVRNVDDARFVRDGSGRVLVVSTAEGSDTLQLWDPSTVENAPLPLGAVGTGRLRIRTAGPRGIGLYQVSTLGGSSWLWLDGNATLHRSRGDVPRYAGRATLTHVWYGRTPVLRYLPEHRAPVAAVVSLHGGPESLERNELRWDGLYRDLLDANVAVLGLNYCGSTGYGPLHTQRAWKAWTTAFREDLESCVAAAAGWGVAPADIALLGGSFGGALALLGCVLRPDLAGAVASAPLIDIQRHAQQATGADPSYRDWFGTRFELDPAAAPAQRVFDPEHLTATAPGQRVFLVHGSEDEVTAWQHSKRAADAATRRGLPWKLITEEGAGHVPTDRAGTARRYGNVHGALLQVLGIAAGR